VKQVWPYWPNSLNVPNLSWRRAQVFAYGQTASGKTHTMEGPSITDPDLRGIIPRTVSALFGGVAAADASIEFTVKVMRVAATPALHPGGGTTSLDR